MDKNKRCSKELAPLKEKYKIKDNYELKEDSISSYF
jgi:hypothetical protein